MASRRVGIVMPLVIRSAAALEYSMRALSCLKAGPDCDADFTVHLMCNVLEGYPPLQLEFVARSVCGLGRKAASVEVVADAERSVSGAWNEGIRRALAQGARSFCVVANDVLMTPSCLPELIRFEDRRNDLTDIWSGVGDGAERDPDGSADGCDFSCFYLTEQTLQAHGFFDENYNPAYFEDNDYYARVILAGREARYVYGAKFAHLGSKTINTDAEQRRKVQIGFERNRDYFRRKWGSAPFGDFANCRRAYYARPFNNPAFPLSYWPKPKD